MPTLEGPDPRTIRLVAVVGGAVLVVVGLLLLTRFPLGEPDPTFGQKVVVPVALLALGASFLGMAAWSALFARQGTELVVDDVHVELRFSRGPPAQFRWDDPNLEVHLSHAFEIAPHPKPALGWVMGQRGRGPRVNGPISIEGGDALIRRAPRLGLETTKLRREFRGRGGRLAYEVTILAPPGKAHIPGPDWNPVTVPPGGVAAVAAPAIEPPRKGPEAFSPRKPPRVPHC